MALVLEGIATVRRRCFEQARGAGTQAALRALFERLNDIGNPDLKFKAISALQTADVVVSDSACKVYALFGRKPTASTTDAWLKASDHATAAAVAGDVAAKFIGTGGGGQEQCICYPDGLKMGTGFTVGCHTTVGAATKSLVADAVTGFALVGAA